MGKMERIRNYYRSWDIMEKYFGVTNPNAAWLEIDFRPHIPPHILKELDDLRHLMEESERKRIANN